MAEPSRVLSGPIRYDPVESSLVQLSFLALFFSLFSLPHLSPTYGHLLERKLLHESCAVSKGKAGDSCVVQVSLDVVVIVVGVGVAVAVANVVSVVATADLLPLV